MIPIDQVKANFQAIMKRRGADVPFERFEAAGVKSDGLRLHLDVIDTEPGRPSLVLIPGTSVYGLVYGDLLAAIADERYNIVSVDPRGHGRSEGARGSYTAAELVRDARAAVSYARDRFGDRIVVAGPSQGGIVALYTAATGEKLAGVICHNAADLADPDNVRLTSRPLLAQLLKPAVKGLAWVLPELEINMARYFNLLSQGDQDVKDRLASDPLSLKSLRLKALASLASAKPERPVEQIATPVLILHGGRDTIFPQDYVERVFQRLTCKKSLKLYPDLSHFLCTDHVDAVVPDMVAWMDEVCGVSGD